MHGQLLEIYIPQNNCYLKSVISGARSSTAHEDSLEEKPKVATYYNPAYRPALEEELSSTDVKHAALCFR